MKNKNYKFPKVKKNIRAFLSEEEGKIAKKNIQKIGLGLVMLGMSTTALIQADKTMAQICSHASHGSHGSHNSW